MDSFKEWRVPLRDDALAIGGRDHQYAYAQTSRDYCYPDYVFFFGGGNDLERFAGEIDRARVQAGILSSAVMVGRAAFSLPPAVAARTYLAYPFSLPERAELSDFIATMQRGGVSLRSAPFQTVAYAAAKVFIEAARNASRQISRKGLIDSLERLQDYQTGVIGPVTFGATAVSVRRVPIS